MRLTHAGESSPGQRGGRAGRGERDFVVRLGKRLRGLFLQELPGREGSGQGLASVQESGERSRKTQGQTQTHATYLLTVGAPTVCASSLENLY